jgi:hypothetical protein
MDDHKVLPYKGQQRFLSWLAYVWPRKPDVLYPTRGEGSFPDLPQSFHRLDEGLSGARASQSLQFRTDGAYEYDGYDDNNRYRRKRSKAVVNAFAPGLASLANTHHDNDVLESHNMNNIEKVDFAERRDDDDDDENNGPSFSSFTPHYGVIFVATRAIPAGSELFLDYGSAWRMRRKNGQEEHTTMTDVYHTNDMWKARAMEAKELSHAPLPTEFRKRRRMEQMSDEVNVLVGGGGMEIISQGARIPNSRVYAHDDDDDKYESDDYDKEWDVAQEEQIENDDDKGNEDLEDQTDNNNNSTTSKNNKKRKNQRLRIVVISTRRI